MRLSKSVLARTKLSSHAIALKLDQTSRDRNNPESDTQPFLPENYHTTPHNKNSKASNSLHLKPLNIPLSDVCFFSAQHTLPSLWQQPTLGEAWMCLNNAINQSAADDSDSSNVDHVAEAWYESDLAELTAVTATAELNKLISMFPPILRFLIASTTSAPRHMLTEVFFHLDQNVTLHFRDGTFVELPFRPDHQDIDVFCQTIASTMISSSPSSDGRVCIPDTLHRVGVFRGRGGRPLGFTIRVGRCISGVACGLADLASRGSVLIVAPPNVGKTTVLRDLIATLSRRRRHRGMRVVVVDTSNEILGDNDAPLPLFGSVRRLQVPCRAEQHRVLVEAVQNHSPELIVVDEISTREEADIICSIAQRGVRVVCTVHGRSLASLMRNHHLNLLVGGSSTVFLSHEEKRSQRRDRKTVLERSGPCPFQSVLELRDPSSFSTHLLYRDPNKVIDSIFKSEDFEAGGQEMAQKVNLTCKFC